MAKSQHGSTRFLLLNSTVSGDVISAPGSGRTIVVTGFCCTVAGTTPTLRFDDNTGSLTGAMAPTAGSVIMCMGSRENPLFACSVNAPLAVTLTGAGVSIQGFLTYMIVTSG